MTAPRFHPPRQSRSQETLDRILDAAESVLDEKSFSEATLAEIVERAGVTVGAFYRRFPDKDALLHHLDERLFSEVHQMADDVLDLRRWTGTSTAEVVREFTHIAIALHRQRRGLLRSVFLRARVDPILRESARGVNGHIIERLCSLLLTRREELRRSDPARAISLGFVVLLAAVRETVLFGEVWPDTAHATDMELERELAEMYVRFIGAD